jgi:signal transduction histidine kinase
MQVDNLAPLQREAEAHERLDALRQGLRRARAVVEQLLSLARSQGEQSLHWQQIDPVQVVREVIADLLPLAESRGIDLGLDRADAVQLQTDPSQLYTLLRNAVDNALRYTPMGGRVDLRVLAARGDLVIEVQDSGPGIPSDQLARVFEPFVRLPGAEGEGSGLGLSIIRQIAQRLRGSVALENAAEGGLILRYTQRLDAARSG